MWLGAIVITSILVAMASRREWVSKRLIRYSLIALLVGGELQRYFKDDMGFPDRLPLHLCNVTTWAAVLGCLTLWTIPCEFAYFWGIVGAGMALITPDMGAAWPPRFFVNHGGLIVTAIALAGGHIMEIRRGAIARAYACFATYIGLIGIYNWRFGTNFAFVARKPNYPTLIDWLGPWPLYIISEGLIGLTLLYLLWLPVRHRAQPAPLLATQDFHGFAAEQAISGQPSRAGSKQG